MLALKNLWAWNCHFWSLCVPTLELLSRTTVSCEHSFEESPTSQEYSKMWWRDHVLSYYLTRNPAGKPYIRNQKTFQKKKKKSNLQLSCLWPICFAHRDKRFIHDLALLMSLEKSLLCAEWSVSLSSFSMKCKAVSSNIGCSDSFPLGRLFLWLFMELYLKILTPRS